MSNYFQTGLGATSAEVMASVPAHIKADFKWNGQGQCIQLSTGKPYPGDQRQSNCQAFQGEFKGSTAAWAFLKDALLPNGGAPMPSNQPLPAASLTAGNILLPAVGIVGGIGLILLITRKKK